MAVIGKRIAVKDIKSVWAKENDFSDWLAGSDGVELLGQDLQIEVENLKREQTSADFRCDIVGNMVGDEKHVVVIENQYGRTDHEHLGKLLTYAAAHKAMTGVWIAETVAPDHRQVIDWLNENTPESISLFVAELKAYTIGNSPPAPQLDVVCRPNEMFKPTDPALSEADLKRREWRRSFWTEIHQRLKDQKVAFRLQAPGVDHWSTIAIGRAGFVVSMLLVPLNQNIGVELVVQPKGWKQAAFDALHAQRHDVEAKLGRTLDWRPMEEKKSSRILLLENLDPADTANREEVKAWFAEWVPKLHEVFRKRVKELQAPATAPGEADEPIA